MDSPAQWDRVDALIEGSLLGDDPVLEACLTRCREAGLPDIAVTPAQGKFLSMLAMLAGAKRILEIGTLGGYSTIWLARGAGPQGDVVTLERDEDYADVARRNLDAAGVGDRIILVGPALDTLPGLAGPFDMVFIDADKQNNIAYLDHALGLVRPGGTIIVDNVVRAGGVLDPAENDPATRVTRDLYARVASEMRLDATAIQTVGSKGWDGMLIARVVG